jgi:hypothetical protein
VIKQNKGKARAAASVSIVATAVAAALILGGCDKLPGGKSADGTAASARSPTDMAKVGAYTEGFNKLVGTYGLVETADDYAKADISRQSAQDPIIVSAGWIEQAQDALKSARAMPGGSKAVDQAADTLIADLDKVLARLRPLKVYYDSKAYRDDGLVRGKAEDPLMKAEFQTALTDMDAFSEALKAERNKHLAVELAALKARGDLLAYNSKLALQQSESLVDLFKSPEDLSDPATLAKGDAIVAQLETTLADQRKAYAEAKAKTGGQIGPTRQIAADQLTSMIGNYRDLKRSRNAEDFNMMQRNYNSAVELLNLPQPIAR